MIAGLSRRQRAACLVPMVVALALAAVAIVARPAPKRVCVMAARVKRVTPDLQAAPEDQPADPKQAIARAVRVIDFDLLARSVPPELRDEVELVRREAPQQLAALGDGDLSALTDELDPTFLSSALALAKWMGDHCG